MNTRFIEVMSRMTSLGIAVASLRDGPDHRGLKRKRSMRWANSPTKESITENIDEKAKDFDEN
jgi:hypothetical protein